MLKRTLIYSLAPLLLLTLAGCSRPSEQKTEQGSEQTGKGAQPGQQPVAPEQQPPAPTAEGQAQAPRPSAAAPAPELKRRPAAGETARGGEPATRTPAEARSTAPAETRRTAPAETRRTVEIPAGAELKVRLNQGLDTDSNAAGDTFTATLEQPVVVDGRTEIPKGTTFHGRVTTSEASGRLKGQAALTVKLESFDLNGKAYRINSTTVSQVSDSRKKRNVGIIGGGAALGAAIGAIAGGGKGAAIGAGAGAAAGTAGAAATGKAQIRIPAETLMLFTLQSPLTIG